MSMALDTILNRAPAAVRSAAVTLGSARLQRVRRSGEYRLWRERYENWRHLSLPSLRQLQQERLHQLLQYAAARSEFYKKRFSGIKRLSLEHIPILEKSDLQTHIDQIVTADKKRLIPGFTGGTTGRSITVYNRKRDLQERFAILDLFWQMHGFLLGRDRIAWFSGRQVAWEGDVRHNRFWSNNWLHKIRYYSTFHMAQNRLGLYVQNLCEFSPLFISGFPSAISELARYVKSRNLRLTFQPRAIFTTSETLTPGEREIIEGVFACAVRDQYSTSEGAPFIVECQASRLHLDLSTGVVEVLGQDGREADEGEMVVTPFFATGTPIIRYRVGDCIKLSSQSSCPCGWQTPLVDAIEGRTTDYIDVPDRGKVFCSQIGDCVKSVTTVLKFQVEVLRGVLHVYLVADERAFECQDKAIFMKKMRERVGDLPVTFHYVNDIPRAQSGKHSVVRRTAPSPALGGAPEDIGSVLQPGRMA